MSDKRLIVNADDFGMSRGITNGILRAHREGIVTSTSMMVNQSASQYAVEQICDLPKLSVGVHLNICEGKPILPREQVSSLVAADGAFHTPKLMSRKLWKCQISFRELEDEFRAQIRWMKDRGIHPTHADSHRHMHIYPGAAMPFYRAVTQEGIRCVRSLRVSHWPRDQKIGGSFRGPFLRRLAISTYRGTLYQCALHRLQFPDYCVVLHPRYRDKLELLSHGWVQVLENLPAGSYEACWHPGMFEAGFSERDEICERRAVELDLLTGPQLASTIQRNQIELISYPQL